jgi:hypothetical protein
MCYAFIYNVLESVNHNVHPDYKASLESWQAKACNLRIGYVPGVIRHFFHGNKKNRKYRERWQILVNHNYSPYKHITTDSDGLLIPSNNCPKEMLDDIMTYFRERNEDE